MQLVCMQEVNYLFKISDVYALIIWVDALARLLLAPEQINLSSKQNIQKRKHLYFISVNS